MTRLIGGEVAPPKGTVPILRYYRNLNRAKFAVIVQMEKGLPERPFADEWAELPLGSRPKPPRQRVLLRFANVLSHRAAP
jgi:hypothetical protein